MKHYISICEHNTAKTAFRVDLFEWSILASLPENASPTKDGSTLVFGGYSDMAEQYPRREDNLTSTSCVFIDCDNPNSDPHIIEKWRDRMKDYDWMIYETASSTKERPKFRAIVPLDRDIPWNKFVKKAVASLFADFTDPKASWFYAPTRDKLNTIEENTTGKWMPSDTVMTRAGKLEENEKFAESLRALLQVKYESKGYKDRGDGWRHLPSVKKCLEGLQQGERDSSLNAACYAMDKNGYRDHILEFLNEVFVERSIKDKFRAKYR